MRSAWPIPKLRSFVMAPRGEVVNGFGLLWQVVMYAAAS